MKAAARTTGETERRQASSDVREALEPILTTSDGPKPRREQINIASNPIGWIFGFYGASVSVAFSDNLAVRGDGNLFKVNDESGYEFGASVVVYLKRVYHGPFFEPGFVIREFGRRGTSTIYGPGITFGWHIGFDSGFNVAAALGAAYNLDNTIGGGHQELLGYFRIGYVF